MALNASGPISIAGTTTGQSIQIELNGNGSTTMSLNDTSVRTLAGPAFATPASTIQMPTNFYGKSNRVTLSQIYSANATNVSLALGSISGYAAGTSDITVTINSGIYLHATSTANSGLTITGGTAGDTLTIVNNGFILGQGGTGGMGPGAGAVGGPALSISIPATINNTNPVAFVAGGGGGGGSNSVAGGGGGAGGGVGGKFGAAGGGIGASGSPQPGPAGGGAEGGGSGGGGGAFQFSPKTGQAGFGGAGGGRILPGVGGTGGRNGNSGNVEGGPGGSANAGGSPANGGGGGGGWGASGGSPNGNVGGAGGKAVTLNGNTVTFTSGNTTRVYGAVS